MIQRIDDGKIESSEETLEEVITFPLVTRLHTSVSSPLRCRSGLENPPPQSHFLPTTRGRKPGSKNDKINLNHCALDKKSLAYFFNKQSIRGKKYPPKMIELTLTTVRLTKKDRIFLQQTNHQGREKGEAEKKNNLNALAINMQHEQAH